MGCKGTVNKEGSDMSTDVYIVEAYDQQGCVTFNRGYLTASVADKHFNRLAARSACVTLFKNFEKVREAVSDEIEQRTKG